MALKVIFNALTGKFDYVSEEDLSGYVPYTGATNNIDLGSWNFTTTGTLGAGATTVTSLVDSGLVSGRFTFAGTSGLLTDYNNITYTNSIGIIAFGGNEKVTNGDFATSAGWTLGDGWTFDGTNFEIDHAAAGTGTVSPTIPLTIETGKKYSLSLTVKNRTAGSVLAACGGVSAIVTGNSNKTFSGVFTAVSTDNLVLSVSATTARLSVDDVTIKEWVDTKAFGFLTTGDNPQTTDYYNLQVTSRDLYTGIVFAQARGYNEANWNEGGVIAYESGGGSAVDFNFYNLNATGNFAFHVANGLINALLIDETGKSSFYGGQVMGVGGECYAPSFRSSGYYSFGSYQTSGMNANQLAFGDSNAAGFSFDHVGVPWVYLGNNLHLAQPYFDALAADTDIVLTFNGTTNIGLLTWMEDEDYFKFSDDILFLDNESAGFGTGAGTPNLADATIKYDGTNLVINPKVVGTGILSLLGGATLGNASTDLITHTGRMIVRTTATDPQDVTPANRPPGTVAEIAYYGGKMYFCTNAATPVWEKITSG